MFFVILKLNFTASVGFVNSFLHRFGDGVCVKKDGGVYISRGSPDGLNQRGLAPQKAFLVCIEDCDRRDLRQIQAFAQ